MTVIDVVEGLAMSGERNKVYVLIDGAKVEVEGTHLDIDGDIIMEVSQ